MRHNSTVHNYRDTAMWSSPLILSWQYFLSTNKQKQPNKMNQYNQCFLFTFDDPQEEKAKEERQELEEAPGRCPNPRRRLHRQPSAQSLPQRRQWVNRKSLQETDRKKKAVKQQEFSKKLTAHQSVVKSQSPNQRETRNPGAPRKRKAHELPR